MCVVVGLVSLGLGTVCYGDCGRFTCIKCVFDGLRGVGLVYVCWLCLFCFVRFVLALFGVVLWVCLCSFSFAICWLGYRGLND